MWGWTRHASAPSPEHDLSVGSWLFMRVLWRVGKWCHYSRCRTSGSGKFGVICGDRRRSRSSAVVSKKEKPAGLASLTCQRLTRRLTTDVPRQAIQEHRPVVVQGARAGGAQGRADS